MPLTNSQYDEIMRGYDERRITNKHIQDKRIAEAYLREPRLEEIDHAISTCSVASARKLLEGDTTALATLRTDIALFQKERASLLTSCGLPENYFAPVYTCPDCQDTGYISGQKCHCLKQAIIDSIYTQSNIKNILGRENFSVFSYDYYSTAQTDPATGLTSLETAKRAVEECRHFIQDFENKPKNLFFYGNTGVGKTFLSNCVAKELLDDGYSVIYFTAFQLFDILSKGVFEKDADAIAAHQNIFDCDLLIIDDLGTELSNAFSTSQLFLCVNERILRQRSTIISTNLNLNQVSDTYSERTFSRILNNYNLIKLFGDDIRIQKRKLH
jgi:DNA replication protein DnaC